MPPQQAHDVAQLHQAKTDAGRPAGFTGQLQGALAPLECRIQITQRRE